MFQCLSYLQNFILLKSVEYVKSYRYLCALFEFVFVMLNQKLDFKPSLHISRKYRKHIVADMYFKLYRF